MFIASGIANISLKKYPSSAAPWQSTSPVIAILVMFPDIALLPNLHGYRAY